MPARRSPRLLKVAAASFVLLGGTATRGQVAAPQGAYTFQQQGGYTVVNTPEGPWFVPRGSGTPDPSVAQDINLEIQLGQAVQQYAAAELDEARAAARSAVKDKLDEQFALRQEHRLREIAELDGRVKRLRDVLRKRAAAKQVIVDRELTDLVSDAEGVGWGEVLGGAMSQSTYQRSRIPIPRQPGAAQPPSDSQKLAEVIQKKYAATEDPAERAAAKEEIRAVLDQLFGAGQERRMREIAELEGQLKRLREALQKRTQAKEQIIDRRLNRLLNEVDGLGWNDAEESPAADRLRRPLGRLRVEVEAEDRPVPQAAPPAAPGRKPATGF